MSDTWTVDEHLDDILRAVRPLEPTELQLLDAHGCVLTEDILVPAALPPFDNSSMDGYAVRAVDVDGANPEYPAVLSVIGDIAAGARELPTVRPGQAARIMTGAPLPPGAETVIPVEWTDGGTGSGFAAAMAAHSTSPEGAGGDVRIYQPAPAGRHIRRKGSDIPAGTIALEAGTVLGPPQLGLVASTGRATVPVRPRPRVVVVSTGSELAQPGRELGPGQIHDSNSFTLAAAARDAGALVYRVTSVDDNAAGLRATLEDQLVRADLIVTSGGVSVGAYDVVKEALADIGEVPGGVEFRRLAMQPGKPQGFGLIGADRVPLLALPGNPVSSYVSFELFVRPALRTLAGHREVHRPRRRARLVCDAPLTSVEGKRQFLRGTLRGDTVAPVGGASSHLAAALARSDALMVIPEDVTEVGPGAEVDVIPLS